MCLFSSVPHLTIGISPPSLPLEGLFCNRTFDMYACWPDGSPGTAVNVSCPFYLPWFEKVKHGLVSRRCGADGQWVTVNGSQAWRDHSPKLHCTRNYIHANLFASFGLRATSVMVKDALLEKRWGMEVVQVADWEALLSHEINLLIFMRILKVILAKLRANQKGYADYKLRLAKATLTLIPLFGIHEVVFIFATDEQTTGILRYVKVFFTLFLNSFQGFLVAVLYCFANKEVKSEMKKKWQLWKLDHPALCCAQ
ncbi:PREDICTED: glucagon receptor-like [Charadrius vociferus]|uniref:glucagon receptor-like n=1 Tax=Charadrius vociferus TaxID=50402 RepID=UPI0005214405|nr:PREDICTED: glucagon receptor-like [Charadrius vociferus]